MPEYFPIFASLILLTVATLLGFVFIRLANPAWWRVRAVRRALWVTPLVACCLIALWTLGIALRFHLLRQSGAFAVGLVLVMLAVVLSFPFSGALHGINFLLRKFFGEKKEFDPSRRTFLGQSASALPALVAVGSTAGVLNSFAEIRVPEIQLAFQNLPRELAGFRIAHITDLHLGYYVQLSNVERMVERIAQSKPDLVLLTGDHSDQLSLLADELAIIHQLKPRYGIYASLGNHEYYRGIKAVRKIFDGSPVPLMVNEGTMIDVRGKKLFVGAIDDPQLLGKDNNEFLRNCIDTVMDGVQSDAFHLLMSHRPEGFNHAADIGISLTLSGHTHGGQVGFGGRSVFERMFPEKYLWGLYKKGNSQLYTSAGCGHWLPFRLGCPAEAPVYVLNRLQ